MIRPAGAFRIRQGGVALIAVLLLVTVILITLGTLFYRHNLDLARVSNSLWQERALLLALSAENWVSTVLRDDLEEGEGDDLQELWAQPIPPLPVEGGQLSGCLIDLQGRFNLNNIAAYPNDQRWQDELGGNQPGFARQLLELFRLTLESPEIRLGFLKDWIDADAIPDLSGGAEDGEYLLLKPARLPANRPLDSTDELTAVDGWSVTELQSLDGLITALPMRTAININTAPGVVLAAALSGRNSGPLDDATVQSVLDRRPFDDIDDAYDALVTLRIADDRSQLLAAIGPETLTVSSQFFQLNSVVELGDVRLLIQSLLYRQTANQIRVLQRKLIPLPELYDREGRRVPEPTGCTLTDDNKTT